MPENHLDPTNTPTDPPDPDHRHNTSREATAECDGLQSGCIATLGLQIAEQAGVEVFCDVTHQPFISLVDDGRTEVWPLEHRRVRAWFAERIHDASCQFPSDRDLQPLLRVLEGQAYRQARRPSSGDSTWQQIENDPVGLGVVAYANLRGEFNGLTRDLLGKLHHEDVQAKLPPCKRPLPKNAQVFSFKLNKMVGLLASIGIIVTIRHTENGSSCSIRIDSQRFTREPDAAFVSASASPSGTTSDDSTASVAADAPDVFPQSGSTTSGFRKETLALIDSIKENRA